MHSLKKVISLAALLLITATSCFAAEGTVVTDVLNIRAQATTDSAVIDKVYNGQILNITSKENSFYNIAYNGGSYYASVDYISINIKSAGVVTTSALNIRTAASAQSASAGLLHSGDVVYITAVFGDWYEIFHNNNLRYVHGDYVELRDGTNLPSRDSLDSVTNSRIVEYSKQFLGTPYVYGGSSPSGFDCSGFTGYIFKQFGYSLPRSSAEQASVGVTVGRNELIAGDLVFFNTYGGISHVGMYIGNNNFIHATLPGDVVKISSLGEAYYSSRYVTARRIIR